MTATAATATPAAPQSAAGPPRWRSLLSLRVLLPVLLTLTLAAAAWRFAVPHGPGEYVVPQDSQMEATYGIR
ncbi:MAG: hypothetical protein ACXV0U_01410, partial [Kineosporiaceae bacterium]